MKKIFFLAIFLLSAESASATQMKVVCCDGSVHYFQGVSLKAFYQYYKDMGDTFKYAQYLGQTECKNCCNGCYRSVTEVTSGTAQVSSTEEQDKLEANTATSTNEIAAEA